MKHGVRIVGAILLFCLVIWAQAPPGTPAKTGQASFSFGGVPSAFDKVDGTFNKSYGFNTINLTYNKTGKPGVGDHLSISLMIQKAGPVNMKQPGNGIGFWKGGAIFTSDNPKSQCTMNVTQISDTSVEGTAECAPINELNGAGTSTLKSVKFSASTK
jgi:hypothetical protein